MTTSPPIAPTSRLVEILAFHDAQILDVAGPLQVFASANALRRDPTASPPYVVRVVARDEYVTTSSGLRIATDHLPRTRRPVDTLIVAGGAGARMAAQDVRVLSWLSRRAQRARRVVSICTGAFILAAAGLLARRRAVTHWAECQRLADAYPDVTVEADAIFVEDSNVWTSAGVTAGIDLSLTLVERDLGADMAATIARDLVVFLRRPGGQAQFSALLAVEAATPLFDNLHAWIADNLRRDLSVAALASKAGMSERNFLRRFKAATGMTPARTVERIRLEIARQLLTTTRQPIKRVAAACGFGSEETMRRSFARHLGISPADFRSRFSLLPLS